MNHNPQNLQIGEVVCLDKGYSNSSKVTILSMTRLQLLTRVRAYDGTEWDVMTYRLSKILSASKNSPSSANNDVRHNQ